jgi:peptidoglycan hydrolase FlgJ
MTNPLSLGRNMAKDLAPMMTSTHELGRIGDAALGEPESAFASELAKVASESTKPNSSESEDPLRQAFHNFVGQTFFSQMLASLRSTQEGAAYFNGGQAEKMFQGQLDQVLSEELTKASASQIADPMFKLFQLQRSS